MVRAQEQASRNPFKKMQLRIVHVSAQVPNSEGPCGVRLHFNRRQDEEGKRETPSTLVNHSVTAPRRQHMKSKTKRKAAFWTVMWGEGEIQEKH